MTDSGHIRRGKMGKALRRGFQLVFQHFSDTGLVKTLESGYHMSLAVDFTQTDRFLYLRRMAACAGVTEAYRSV
jgi:hypothetical protein